MNRTNNCGELTKSNLGETVKLSGWVNKIREKGFIIWVDLRDRYGITQLVFDKERSNDEIFTTASQLGREFVIEVEGSVIERKSINENIDTGEIEILVTSINILNKSLTPPFTIENESDGGEELRMKYRYLDIRREPIRENLIFRHSLSLEVRNYLSKNNFIDVETPCLIKSTPEGARDFIVPSRLNPDHYYALPQSPQIFKQLLMIGGIDKYYQIVKCFRDEDLRADRQPEFTQIDCEMAFVEQEDILNMFEGLIVHLLKTIKGIKLSKFPRITYEEAIKRYGTDKPDIRFDMEFVELTDLCKKNNFIVFDNAELVVGFNIKDGASFSRKEIDKLIDFSKTPQVGAKGLVYCKYNYDETIKSSVDKFFSKNDLTKWVTKCNSSPGDLILIMAGETKDVRKSLSMLRLHIAEKIGLRDPKVFAPLWVLDFPLLEWDEESQRYHAMHHPFTAPKPDDVKKLHSDPGLVKANAYDLVINGNEIGGGSIRIHNKNLQSQMFKHLGFTDKEAKEQFGFLMNAFEYGAPPHGGVAFGFDRLCAIMGGSESIRDFIAFPKNNSGRDIMLDAPSKINNEQLDELGLKKIDQNDSSRNTN